MKMSKLLVFLLASIIILLLYIVVIIIAFLRSRVKLNNSLEYSRIINRIEKVWNEISYNKSDFERYKEINDYINSISVLFERFLDDEESIHIISVGVFDDRRLLLLKEYKKAPGYIKRIVTKYSDLLCDIYKRKHPIKYQYEKVKTRSVWWFAYCYVYFCIMYKKVTGALPRNNRKEIPFTLKADGKDYKRLKNVEPGICNASL